MGWSVEEHRRRAWLGKELAWGKRWLIVREELVGRTGESQRAHKGTSDRHRTGWKWMVLEEGGGDSLEVA